MTTQECMRVQQILLEVKKQGKYDFHDWEKEKYGENRINKGEFFCIDVVGCQLWICYLDYKKRNLAGLYDPKDVSQIPGRWYSYQPIYCISRNCRDDFGDNVNDPISVKRLLEWYNETKAVQNETETEGNEG